MSCRSALLRRCRFSSHTQPDCSYDIRRRASFVEELVTDSPRVVAKGLFYCHHSLIAGDNSPSHQLRGSRPLSFYPLHSPLPLLAEAPPMTLHTSDHT